MSKFEWFIVFILAVILLLGGVTIYNAHANSPIFPDSDPTDNKAMVWCPNDCDVDVRDGEFKLKCTFKWSEVKTIQGKLNETCWCYCTEGTDGLIYPMCECRDFM